jgi:hypothetical protein
VSDEEMIRRLDAAFDEQVPEPSADRIAAIRRAAEQARAEAASSPIVPAAPVVRTTSRRTALIGAAAAVVGVAGGAVVTKVVTDDDASTVAGPPREPVTWAPGPATVAGSALGAELINHTWGVEVLLDATGLPVGTAYRIVYLDGGGSSIEAGGFLGAELPIHCRCNAALLRADLRSIEIRDGDDQVVASAQFT